MPGSCQPLDSNRTTLIFTAVSTRELRFRLSPDRSLRPFEPCLPRTAKQPPTGPGWIHEIKHDGFRILARRDARGVRLFTRNGYNFTDRFPMIVAAVGELARTVMFHRLRGDRCRSNRAVSVRSAPLPAA